MKRDWVKGVKENIVVDALFNNYEIPKGVIWDCDEDHLTSRIEELGRETCSSLTIPDKYHIVTQPFWNQWKNLHIPILVELDKLSEGCVACFLLRSTFIGGQKRFEDLFSVYPPKVILQFARRIKYNSGYSHNCAWFIWEKGWRGETTVRWISKFTSDY